MIRLPMQVFHSLDGAFALYPSNYFGAYVLTEPVTRGEERVNIQKNKIDASWVNN
jgi:hypothetical protein